ncbi:hypothetical protein LPJ61_003212 [Coemansia biformis]|uniref:Uncharacterized protein n=1 Tax=Coemansia biformis TaxID=1286918 RepID=A0A9W7YDB0_9FUNG|nr:hypothetical protein LPJ61_003212 [Coemansia biformis]
MSFRTVIPADGKTDEQRYDEFMEYMSKDGVIESALEPDYDGEYAGIIQEQIAADLSPIGLVLGENKELLAARHRAMLIRRGIDAEVRALCKELDGQVKYDLSEQDMASIKELDLAEDEVEDNIHVRPFCLYEVDIKNIYKKDLSALPESAVDFAKMALEHEMDCQYEDTDDEEWEDEDEDDSDEDDSDEDDSDDDEDDDEDGDDDEDEESSAGGKGKGKGKGKGAAADEDDEEEEDDEEHVHGEHCSHDHDDLVNLNDELPFDEEETSLNPAADGLALLKDRQAEVVELLEKTVGAKIDSFKSFHFPGRHYIVAWLDGLGIFGVRISYPMLISDSDDEYESGDDSDEAGESSSSK